jgi:hypothetical protein
MKNTELSIHVGEFRVLDRRPTALHGPTWECEDVLCWGGFRQIGIGDRVRHARVRDFSVGTSLVSVDSQADAVRVKMAFCAIRRAVIAH